ncbi:MULTISPECIES: hypothetical protein [Streptomyces]|uniref:Uncharacterized protein n=2 Tax=root TaxID=1 RepID=F2R696_STRVP|nr:hypothetical protein [Streptomyces venezuelae]YP_010754215.1 hypothetical protein QEH31_gp03 [Streptomyces phage Chymera]AMS01562.1 hypothetical protein SEA_CHYMERA_3 [Streptomyces phage Chymera]APE22033.1 hypothetical protein vnz_14070 [Streptomyces venezuelae]QER99421.1 hypothetical protein DEJ43_14245 [Streptomyces venezuelae ATCC 10712]CCA56147.1 hypothetical protein SVEN_2861 [Streptomyces venezuelae ATCC 10712]
MDRWDVLALLGITLLGLGLGLLAPWLGVAAAGLVLLAVGIAGALGELRAARTSGQPQKGA